MSSISDCIGVWRRRYNRQGNRTMPTKTDSTKTDNLRQRANNILSNSDNFKKQLPLDQLQRSLQELSVYKIELEMQNEALRRTQSELEISRELYFDLYNLAPVGYLTLDINGRILEANLTVATMLGVNRGTLLNQPLSRFISPEDREACQLKRSLLSETGTAQSWDVSMLRLSGNVFRAHLQAIPGQKGEYKITLEDTSELWLIEQEMTKTQKIESLGILAGGIAHDFKNTLAVILGNISLARRQLHEPLKVAIRLQEAERATERAKNLANQLLTFAKGGDPIKKTIDVRATLKEAVSFALTGSNVKSLFFLAEDLLTVEADEGQILQVIHNLVLNAVHAMQEGGTIEVNARNVSARHSGNKFVRFSIADTGFGISEQDLPKIFDPYFTTKQFGSGLGLSSSYSIIKKHGGKIRAISILGKGSTFTISLPASIQECKPGPIPQQELTLGCGHILLMDDEEMIREFVRISLEILGYTVECAENNSQAVELYLKSEQEGAPFSAVILDLTIPGGVGGQETIKKLLEIDPTVKAIVCSGFSDSPVLANYCQYGFSGMLCKPFTFEELSNSLHDLLKA